MASTLRYSSIDSSIHLWSSKPLHTWGEGASERWRLRVHAGAGLTPSSTGLQSPDSAPLCLVLAGAGRRLNRRWQSSVCVNHLCDKMRQTPCLGGACCLVARTEFMSRECKNMCNPLSTQCNPGGPHLSSSCVGPVRNMILSFEAKLCVHRTVIQGSTLSTLWVCGSMIGNPGPGDDKCHRNTQHFHMISLKPTEWLKSTSIIIWCWEQILKPVVQSGPKGGLGLQLPSHHHPSPTDPVRCLHLTSHPSMETI